MSDLEQSKALLDEFREAITSLNDLRHAEDALSGIHAGQRVALHTFINERRSAALRRLHATEAVLLRRMTGRVVTTNEYLTESRKAGGVSRYFPLAPRIVCKDGFSISVQANCGSHCTPRDNQGPWIDVECGYPSAAPHLIMSYAEDPDNPTETIYPHVPVALVDDLIAEHGGMVEDKS